MSKEFEMNSSKAEWKDKAIIFCGHRKAGTTMLLNLFDSHPDLAVFPVDSGFFYRYFPYFDQKIQESMNRAEKVAEVMFETLREGFDLLEERPSFEYPVDELKQRFIQNMGNRKSTAGELLSEAVYVYQEILSAIMPEQFKQPSKISGWVEKTTSTEIYAQDVFNWFPNAKMVHMIRDPRDNFGSLKSGWNKRYKDFNDSLSRVLQSMVDRSLVGMKAASINEEIFGKDRYKVIQFERLTADPEEVLRDLCGFLELDYHETLLTPTLCGIPWKGNNFEGRKFLKPSSQNVNKWKDRITEHEAAFIEFYFADEMSRWGYEPVFSKQRQLQAASDHYKWYNFAQPFSALTSSHK